MMASCRERPRRQSKIFRCLIRLDVGAVDHLSSFFSLFDDQPCEVSGRTREYHACQVVKSSLRNALKLTGLYWREKRNAKTPTIRHNTVLSARLPTAFDGFTVLHISDMHVDMNP